VCTSTLLTSNRKRVAAIQTCRVVDTVQAPWNIISTHFGECFFWWWRRRRIIWNVIWVESNRHVWLDESGLVTGVLLQDLLKLTLSSCELNEVEATFIGVPF